MYFSIPDLKIEMLHQRHGKKVAIEPGLGGKSLLVLKNFRLSAIIFSESTVQM